MRFKMRRVSDANGRFQAAAFHAMGIVTMTWIGMAGLLAQSNSSSVVPQQIPFNGSAKDLGGHPITGMAGATFSLYRTEDGGVALWTETQNIQCDTEGRYAAQLGVTKRDGVPMDLFTSGDARWLGISINGQPEQPRVLLLSVPYALKAGDAQTIGGLPPSAFLLSAPGRNSLGFSGQAANTSATPDLGGGGTTGFLPEWIDNLGDLGNSVVFQSGAGNTAKVGINTTTPTATLDVKGPEIVRGTFTLPATGTATATTGKVSQAENLTASAFNSTTGAAVSKTFQWIAEPAANNSASPSATLNLLFGSGGAAPSETGLNVASNGRVTFASGQVFPGTIAGITTGNGSGLMGGGNSGNLNLQLTNTCTNGQVLQSNAGSWNCASMGGGTITGVTAGTDMLGGGTTGNVTLSLDTSKVPQLAAANTFTATQNIVGSLGVGSSTTTATVQLSGKDGGFTGVQNVTTNTSTAAGPSFAVVAATSIAGVTAEMVADGHGSGPIGAASGYIGTYTNSPFGIITANQQRLVISNTGQIGINYSPFSATDTTALTVYADPSRDFDAAVFEAASGGVGAVLQGGSGGGAGGILAGGDSSGVGGDGIDAYAGNGTPAGYAGAFFGNVAITGFLSKAGGSFKIDHPMDPANKYLYHSFVESPDMMNIYNGIATLDASGQASVQLPEWFETLNRDFRYQLTAIGAPGPNLFVAGEVSQNHFVIGGGTPGMRVSWQVTGIRQDPWANAHRIPVEEDKPASDRGLYLHPELYQAPKDKGIEWVPRARMAEHGKNPARP